MKKINIKISIILAAFAIAFAAGSCSSGTNQQEHAGESEAHSEEAHAAEEGDAHNHSGPLMELKESLSENEVLVTEKQMENVNIELGEISQQQLSQLVKSFGEIALAPSDEATVSPVLGGIISNIKVIEGDYVRRGQVLARIEHPEIVDIQQNYLEAMNRNEFLETEYNRQKRLLEDSVNSAKTYQNVRSEYQSNLAKLQSLKQKLNLIHIDAGSLTPENISDSYPLLAPISGYIAQVNVNPGSHVAPEQLLFHITANDKAHIDLKVFEKDISKIGEGQKFTFTPANNTTVQPMSGEIMKMAKRFDSEQRTALVHASISEMNESLLPGMSVIAYIQTGGRPMNTLPEAAFVSDQGQDFVFLLKKEGKTEDEHAHEEATAEEHEQEENHAGEEVDHDDEHGDEHGESIHYFIFEKLPVNKTISEGGYTGLVLNETTPANGVYAISNAQALLSEMKKGAAGHAGHAH